MKRHFSLIDPLRFFAAFWVMNYHYLLTNVANPPLSWYRFGNMGVPIFFVISGFVIVQSVKDKSLREFSQGRFLRLFPLFWVLCSITFVLTLLLPDSTYTIHISDYIRSMTMLSDLFEPLFGPSTLVDSSYWTLTVELLFYVGIGCFVHFFDYKNLRYFFTILLAISMGVFALHLEYTYWAKVFLASYAAYFAFGGMLAMIATAQEYRREQLYDYTILFIAALYATCIHTQALTLYETSNPHDQLVVSIIHIAIFVGIPALVYLSKYIRGARTLRILALVGALTYPLYLLHQRIGNISIKWIAEHSSFAWMTIVITTEVGMLVLALALSLIEPRMRRYFTKKKNVGATEAR